MVLSLVMLVFVFSNASSFFDPHWNLAFLCVNALSGAVKDEYLGMSFDR